MGMMLWVRFVGWALLAAGISSAQVDYATATLKGSVLDPQEKEVLGARVTAVNQATGRSASAVTTEDGYLIPALAPGDYRIESEAPGFSKTVAANVALTVGQLATYDIRMRLGSEASSIEVAADIPVVQPQQTQQANIINDVQVENLPNITRNFVQSIYTLPGVVNSFAPALQNPGVGTAYLSSGFSVGGSNGRSNLVTIDGGENDFGSGTQRVTHVPIDSIQEFQVNRNSFAAEFGFTLGTAINMVTRSGGNRLHGNASAYFHNRATDAENFFDKLEEPGSKPFEQSAIFSAAVGGPIRKNHLFFFTAPEYQKLDAATVQNISGRGEFQPVSSQANGYDLSTGVCPNQKTAQQQVTQFCYLTQLSHASGPLGALGAALLASPVFGDPFQNPILNALVKPNDGTFNGIVSGPAGSGFRGIPGLNTPRGRYANWVTRLDYTPGARDTFMLRWSLMHETDNIVPAPPFSGSEHQSDVTITGSWTRVSGSNLVNTVRAQYVPTFTFSVYAAPPNGSEIDLGGSIQLGTPFSYPYDAHWKRLQFDDSLSWVRGNHTLKFGGSWRPDHYSVSQHLWFGGQWQFNDAAFSILNIVGAQAGSNVGAALSAYNLSQGYPAGGPPSTNLTAVQSYLAGTPTLLIQANPESNPHWADWAQSAGFYAQDTWKASPQLTLNYGLRLDVNAETSPVPGSVWFTPRVGIAWNARGNQKTVVRVGGGIFVAPNVFMIPFYTNTVGTSGKYINQGAVVAGVPSPPFPSIFSTWALQAGNATTAVPNPALSNAQLASLGIVIGPPGPTAFGNIFFTLAPNFKPAYTIQSSISVAREIARHYSLEAGYLLYRSVHVEQVLETNFVRDPSAPVDPFAGPYYAPRPGTTAGEPNSSIFQNGAFSSVGSGIYNGGTVSLTRRFDRGLQFQVNYTLSRAIDDTSDFSSLSTPFRSDLLNLERAQSDFNIKHNFVANAVYTTPFHAGKGAWYTRLLAHWTISPIVYARSGVPLTLLAPGLSNGTIGHNSTARPWYEGRNNGTGPTYVSWDMRVSRRLIGGENGRRVDFIAQSQNLLNHVNFAAVQNNFPADPNYPLPNGGTLANGPYNVSGFVPKSVAQLSQPLAFTTAFPARQISLSLRFAF